MDRMILEGNYFRLLYSAGEIFLDVNGVWPTASVHIRLVLLFSFRTSYSVSNDPVISNLKV